MPRVLAVIKRTVISFYDDQMTQHAGAVTYYSMMSLFPAILLALSVLGLVGEYPRTYDAIVRYLSDVAPASVVRPIDESLRDAFRHKSTATTGLVFSVVLAFFGTTGVLESLRRALNVAFRVEGGRSFVRRKAIDVVSTFVLLTLVLVTLLFVVVGRGLAEDILHLVGADESTASVWSFVRWPAAVLSALLGFSYVYYVTPDYKHRAWHLVTPGAILGVASWLAVSYGLSQYISKVVNVGALYGTFTGAMVVVIWFWLSSCALLMGAELNAAILLESGRSPDTTELPEDGRALSRRDPLRDADGRPLPGPDPHATDPDRAHMVDPDDGDEPTLVAPRPGAAPRATAADPGPDADDDAPARVVRRPDDGPAG
jgi:membrane protein